MPGLSIDDIEIHLKNGTLPDFYQIQTPCSLYSDRLISILSKFKKNQQMLYFITRLSQTADIFVIAKNTSISMGSTARFVKAYAMDGIHSRKISDEKRDVICHHIKKSRFDREQLIYLLQNLDREDIRDLILSPYCPSRSDLLQLSHEYSFLSTIHSDTIKLLYHYFNPKRLWQESQTPLLDMTYFTYRVGHVLGLSKYIEFESQCRKFKFDPQGEYCEVSLNLLMNHMDAYRQANPSKIANAIFEALQHSYRLIEYQSNAYRSGTEIDFFERYKNKQLTFLSAGWSGHGVGLAFYGKYLIYTNRGQAGDRRFGSKIFEIKNINLVNPSLFRNLISHLHSPSEFHAILETIIDLKDPVAKFRSKPQKRGTCTYVNPKSSVEPMIVLLKAGPFASKEKLLEVYLEEYNRKKYKHFTTFTRNREIDELIVDMFYAKHPDLIRFFAELTKAIIREHHGKDRGFIKDDQEVARAIDLFERIPDKVKTHIVKDIQFMTRMDELKAKNQQFLDKRNSSKIKWAHVKYLYDHKKMKAHKISIDNGCIVNVDGNPTPKMHFSYREARRLISAVC